MPLELTSEAWGAVAWIMIMLGLVMWYDAHNGRWW